GNRTAPQTRSCARGSRQVLAFVQSPQGSYHHYWQHLRYRQLSSAQNRGERVAVVAPTCFVLFCNQSKRPAIYGYRLRRPIARQAQLVRSSRRHSSKALSRRRDGDGQLPVRFCGSNVRPCRFPSLVLTTFARVLVKRVEGLLSP